MKEELKNKVEIINEITTTINTTTDLDGVTNKEICKTVSNRVNLEGLSESFLMDYFGLKVSIDWPNEQGQREIPKE